MKTLVVYDSVYGNTKAVARQIGEALGSAFPDGVPVLHLDGVELAEIQAADLLVLGAPTHGALPSEAMQGLLGRIGAPAQQGAMVATFDTRLAWPFLERWGGFAAPKMAEILRAKGWTIALPPEGFYVKGLRKGPLKKGEAERAAAWGKQSVELGAEEMNGGG